MLTRIASAIKHKGFIRYFKNSAWMFGEQIFRMVAGLLVGIWVARYLGPEQFGIFNYAITFAMLFSSIAKLGLDGIIVRELVNHPEKQDVYLSTAFWMKVIGALVSITLIALILPWTSNDRNTNLYILIIASGLIFQGFEVIDFYFQSKVLAKTVSLCKIVQLIVSSFFKIYLVVTHAELIWFVAVILFDQFMLAFSLLFAYLHQKDKKFPTFHFDIHIAINFLQNSWPLLLAGALGMVYLRIDQLMISSILGSHELGIYSVAVRLSEIFFIIPTLLTTSLFPAIVNAKNTDQTLYIKRLQRLYTLMTWTAISIAIPITFLSKLIIISLYGEAYSAASTTFAINIWTNIFTFLGVASSKWFLLENLQKLALLRTLYGAIINIGLNLILIPKFGIIGAAASTFISYATAAFVSDFFHEKTRELFLMKLHSFNFLKLLTLAEKHL